MDSIQRHFQTMDMQRVICPISNHQIIERAEESQVQRVDKNYLYLSTRSQVGARWSSLQTISNSRREAKWKMHEAMVRGSQAC